MIDLKPFRHHMVGLLGMVGGVVFAMQAASSQHAPASAMQPLALPIVVPTTDCAALKNSEVSQSVGATTMITSVAIVDDHRSAAYCSVKVVVDDYARFELHLPISVWTQRLLFGGGPGAQTASGLKLDQFATVSWEDLGRRSDEDVFANNYRFHVNAGYRGMHLQVLAAKALIANFTGKARVSPITTRAQTRAVRA